ncbi:MAG: Carboxypeptidase regulatory-like domain [Fibrobacterota bacterium]|jgi:hypothetical protein
MIGTRPRRIRSLALGCILPLLAACGDTRSVGGTGSETTALGARVLQIDGSPAPGVKVKLIDLEQWGRRTVSDSSAAVDSVATDSSGQFRFEGMPPGEYALEILDRDAAIHQGNLAIPFTGGASPLPDLRMQRVARLSGTVRCAGSRPVRVLLAGTGISAKVDSVGAFSFPAIPPGDYDILVALSDAQGFSWQRAGRVEVAPGQTLAGLDLNVDSRRVLIDDFDDGDRFSLLRQLLRGGWWYYHDDSAYGGTSRLEPVTAEKNLGLATTDSSAWAGRSLHAQFRIGSTGTTQFALIGVEVAPRRALQTAKGWVDLGSMDSLVFMAKGSGRVRIQFTTRRMQELTGGTVQFEASFAPTDTWTRVAIPRNAILLPSNPKVASLAWSEAAPQVGTIQFLVNKDTELWLDDLTLVGVGLETLLRGAQ